MVYEDDGENVAEEFIQPGKEEVEVPPVSGERRRLGAVSASRPKTKQEKETARKNALDSKVANSAKNDTMKVYMHDIGQISLVTKTDEVELAAVIHGEDSFAHDEARSTLIKANLRLVVKIAHAGFDFRGKYRFDAGGGKIRPGQRGQVQLLRRLVD